MEKIETQEAHKAYEREMQKEYEREAYEAYEREMQKEYDGYKSELRKEYDREMRGYQEVNDNEKSSRIFGNYKRKS